MQRLLPGVLLFLLPIICFAQGTYQRTQIVNDAKNEIGRPYVYGGERPSGFDCSGLVQYVFGNNGYSLPRTSRDQSSIASKRKLRRLQPGDLIFFGSGKKVNHVGIVSRNVNGQLYMVHSGSSTGVEEIEVYSNNYWSRRISFGGSVLDDEDLLAVEPPEKIKTERGRSSKPSSGANQPRARTRTGTSSSAGRPSSGSSRSTISAEDLKRWREKQKRKIEKAKAKLKKRKERRKNRKMKRAKKR